MRKQTGFAHLGILLLIVVVGVAGGIGWYVWQANKPSEKAPTPNLPLTASSDLKKFVESVGQTVTSKYTFVSTSGNVGGTHYKKANYDFYVSDSLGYGMTFSEAKENTERIKIENEKSNITITITDQLKASGLYESPKLEEKSEDNVITKWFVNSDIACSFSTSYDEEVYGYLDCSKFLDLDSQYRQIKPLAEVQNRTSKAKIDNQSIVRLSGLESARTEGYQVASLAIGERFGIGGYVSVFYRKDNGPWHHFHSGHQGPDCSIYEASQDTRNAFRGNECFDGETRENRIIE